MSAEFYHAEAERASRLATEGRDAILAELADIAEEAAWTPSLATIHDEMITVEALADAYRSRDGWDQIYLLEALMRCHERFRDWIGAYS